MAIVLSVLFRSEDKVAIREHRLRQENPVGSAEIAEKHEGDAAVAEWLRDQQAEQVLDNPVHAQKHGGAHLALKIVTSAGSQNRHQ